MNGTWRTFHAGENDEGRRLDRVLRKLLPSVPLSRIYTALRKGQVRLNDRKAGPADKVRARDKLGIVASLADPAAPGGSPAAGGSPGAGGGVEKLIVFENEHLLALNKPRGLLVHGEDSLALMVQSYLTSVIPSSLSFTPGPLHRLDRNTTGLLFFGRSLSGARVFSSLLAAGRIEKLYLAVLEGRLCRRVVWEDALERSEASLITGEASGSEGRQAKTLCAPLTSSGGRTLCLLKISSGRTHQIRAQASIHGHPLSGDRKYGGGSLPGGYILHSWAVGLHDEMPELGFTKLSAPLPPHGARSIEVLFGEGVLDAVSPFAVLDASE